jgi:hypothetical protein
MRRTAIALGVVTLCWSPLVAADRLTDRDVKSLAERIEQGRDKFEDALDSDLKNKVLRGPSGEVDVKRFLDDFQENIKRFRERLKPEYAASQEAGTILRQASSIDTFFRNQPSGTKGESEWNRLATDMKALASAYSCDFPLAEGAAVRRVGDRELATAAEQLEKTAQSMKKTLDQDLKKDTSIDPQSRQSIVGDAVQLSKSAKVLRERVKDGKPSSAEAKQVLTDASKLETTVGSHQAPASASAWAGARNNLQKIASAYNAQWPNPSAYNAPKPSAYDAPQQ